MRTQSIKYFLLLGLVIITLVSPGFATTLIVEPRPVTAKKIQDYRLKDWRQVYGRKLSFREKISWLVVKKQLRKNKFPAPGKIRDRGKTALTLGILSLVFLFIPFVNLASLPLAILAIIKGNEARHSDPYDRRGKTAVKLGWITIGLLVVIGIAVAIVLTFGSIGPR
jgi:uncharacterized protein involved in cysteine biosynthesis